MLRRSPFSWFFIILLFLPILVLFTILLLPFPSFKMVLDHFSRDGNLSILIPQNAIVFRMLMAMLCGVLCGVLAVTLTRKWNTAATFVGQFSKDFRSFFALQKISKKEVGFLVILLAIIIIAVVRRIASIERPMLHDEAYTVVTFSDTFFHSISDYSLPNNHVLHTILVVLSIHFFGLAAWVVRLPAFIAGVLLVPGVYFLGKRLYDPWTGILAALLVAVTPDLISYSVNARGYTIVALITLIIFILGHSVLRKRNLFSWGLIGLFSALGFFTVPIMLFPFGILFVWLFLENWAGDTASYASKGQFLRYWLAAGLLAAIVTVLLYTPILIYTNPQKLLANSFVAPLPWGDLLETWRARLSEIWKIWTSGIPLPVLLALGFGWTFALIFHRRISAVRYPIQLAAVFWIISLLVVQRYNAWEKVWVFLLPFMLMWASAGLMGLLRKVRFSFSFEFSLAAIIALVLILVSLWSTTRLLPRLPNLLAQHGDVENAAIFLKNNMNDTDLVVVDWPDDSPFWFYFLQYKIKNDHFDKRIPYERAWIVVNPPDNQTITSVLADRGPDYPPLNLEAVQLINQMGTRQLFLCPIQ